METLSQSKPFFVRCIKSNLDKRPLKFDDSIVLRQLRYTGMLATVRIRQSGYSYRVTHEAFRAQYRILLAHGCRSSREHLEAFFVSKLNWSTKNFQIGKTKVFLREAEKMVLDTLLHQEIMRRLVTLQRWFRSRLERARFLRMRRASITIQVHLHFRFSTRQI